MMLKILRSIFVGFGALAFLFTIGAIANNYTVSQGTGTTFGSVVIGGVNFASQLICDATTGNQCAAVDGSGNLSVNATIHGTPNVNVTGTPNVAVTNTPSVTISGTPAVTASITGQTPPLTVTPNPPFFVTLSNNNAAVINAQGQLSANVNVNLLNGAAFTPDPCSVLVKTGVNISQNANATVITGTSSKKTYICSLSLIVGAAANLSIVEGTGTVCAIATGAIIGGTTTGMALPANGGMTYGNGAATVIPVLSANQDNVCILSGVQTNGNLTYVQQ